MKSGVGEEVDGIIEHGNLEILGLSILLDEDVGIRGCGNHGYERRRDE